MSKTIRIQRANLLLFVALLAAGITHCRDDGPQEIRTSPFSGSVQGWEIKGKCIDARTWNEDGDSNIVVISEIQQEEYCEKNHVSAVFGYGFQKSGGHWKKLWEVKEFNRGACQSVLYADSSFRVFDVDGTKPAETLFFYSIGQDGADPIETKMIFRWNAQKAPIRGKIPWTQEDMDAYEMNLDPKLKSSPKMIQDFAVLQWRRFLIEKFGHILEFP